MGGEPIAEMQSYNLMPKDSDLFRHRTAFVPESFRAAGLEAGRKPSGGVRSAERSCDPHSFHPSISFFAVLHTRVRMAR